MDARGFDCTDEARIGSTPKFLTSEQREILTRWWLAQRRRANIPNWDIAATATIEDREGLVLVEAKAHAKELKIEGKPPGNPDNHQRIAGAIHEANDALNGIMPGWSLSCDSQYQLSNRFAWSWKIASFGVPVVLVYLGFLNASEMTDQGETFRDHVEWERVVRIHSEGVVPEAGSNTRLDVAGTPLRTIIQSTQVELLHATGIPRPEIERAMMDSWDELAGTIGSSYTLQPTKEPLRTSWHGT